MAVAASKPEVSILQNDAQPMSGFNLTLRCRMRGYPVPTITWYKDEKQLNANDRISTNPDGELFIKGLGVSDNGIYTCEASNDVGKDQKKVVINVQEPVTEAPGIAIGMSCLVLVPSQLNPKPRCQRRLQISNLDPRLPLLCLP